MLNVLVNDGLIRFSNYCTILHTYAHIMNIIDYTLIHELDLQ